MADCSIVVARGGREKSRKGIRYWKGGDKLVVLVKNQVMLKQKSDHSSREKLQYLIFE
jgi:hypothetical protein